MVQIKKKTLIFIIVVSIVLGSIGSVLVVKSGIAGSKLLTSDEYEVLTDYKKNYIKLDAIKGFISNHYYQPLSDVDLMEGAYKGLIDAVNDEYTTYISSSEFMDFMSDLMGTSTYCGVGITFLTAPFENGFYISSVNPTGPAYAAGIRKGTYIVAVDGVPFTEFDGDNLSSHIRGEKGTEVVIDIKGYDGVQHYTLKRSEISNYSVEYALKKDESGKNIAVISISQFIVSTAHEFKPALEKAEEEADYLVLDLRDCPGGLVDQCIQVADMLMNEGVIISTRKQDGTGDVYKATTGRTPLEYVVLVNANTASAAEILSCGIKENKEALIIGDTTYGKGIIQNTNTFSDGSAVKYTESQYVSPLGNEIHKVGVKPDIEISLTDECYNEEGLLENDVQLEKAVEVLLGGE